MLIQIPYNYHFILLICPETTLLYLRTGSWSGMRMEVSVEPANTWWGSALKQPLPWYLNTTHQCMSAYKNGSPLTQHLVLSCTHAKSNLFKRTCANSNPFKLSRSHAQPNTLKGAMYVPIPSMGAVQSQIISRAAVKIKFLQGDVCNRD